MKKFLCIIALTALAACAYDQQPAPYQAYSNDFYGKNGRRAENANANYVGSGRSNGDYSYSRRTENTDFSSASNPDDYNRRIDEQNSTRVVSRPLGAERTARVGETYSHQQITDSSGNTARRLAPVAIDGDQQAVRVSSSGNSIHSGGSYGLQRNSGHMEPIQHEEESVPVVEKKEAFVNPSQLNQERKVSGGLDRIKPMPKPKFTETVEVETVKAAPVASTKPGAQAKPKITPKIQKIETSSGSIDRSTPKMLNESMPNDEEEVAADDNDDDTAPVIEAKPVVEIEKSAAAAKKEIKEVASLDAPEKTEAVEKKPAGKAISFIKPVDGQVISEFGGDKAGGGFNDGISIQAPEGTPVKAASGGTVVYSGNQLQGYGNLIIIRHQSGYLSSYSHLKELELKKGENISQGDIVGHVGKTGNVPSPQLHFGIRKGREPVDPKNYL